MSDGSKVRVELDMSEIVASHVFETTRKEIDEAGAKHVFDGFGVMRIVVNNHPVILVQMHEDSDGGVVLDVHTINEQGSTNRLGVRVLLEERGVVPPRTGRRS